MKKLTVVLAAVLALSVPMLSHAHEHGEHDNQATMDMTHETMHNHHDDQCAKECDMLLKECAQEVDTIQQHIQRLRAEIQDKGATVYNREELQVLNKKLKETNELIRSLQKPGH
jgi:peptidoglycan hydrolase CwlO-like protein